MNDDDPPEGIWLHLGCGGRVIWDLSGGFCTRCEAEGLDVSDTVKS